MATKLTMSVRQAARVLSNAAGAWLPIGHKAVPPVVTSQFGAPRFTPEQQTANPDQPMTRLVKDILRAGSWKVGMNDGKPVMWHVDRPVLDKIANNFLIGQHRGIAMNLTKSHGDLTTGIVPTDDLICPLDEIAVDGNTLWASVYVTPEQAKYLTNPARKVSPGIWPQWFDGLGNKYSDMLLHVAVTDQPVQPGQGPFVAMANISKGTNVDFDFDAVKSLFNQLLTACGGQPLPDSVTADNFVTIASIIVQMVAGQEAAEDEPADSLADASAGGDGTDPMAMANPAIVNPALKVAAPAWAQGLMAQVKALSNTVVQLQQGTQNQAKAAYMAKVLSLAQECKINPAQRTLLEQQGAATGYALNNLAIYDLNPGRQQQPQGRAAKVLGNAQEPAVDAGGKKVLSDAEHAAELAKRGLKPVAIH